MVPTQSSTNFLFHFPKFHLSPFLISFSLSFLYLSHHSFTNLRICEGTLATIIYLSICLHIHLSIYVSSICPRPQGNFGPRNIVRNMHQYSDTSWKGNNFGIGWSTFFIGIQYSIFRLLICILSTNSILISISRIVL